MKILLPLLFAVLVGCKTIPCEPEIITKTEYVTKKPPSELMIIPKQVEPIDMDKATSADAASFLVGIHNRMVELENKLIGISKFFNEN